MSDEEKLRTYLKRATADLGVLSKRLADMEEAAREPIAIIGMGCRYPGGVESPDGLWRLVSDGADAITEFPPDRGWDVVYDPDPDRPGTTYSRSGGFLADGAGFDAGFFGISPREALAMDPQQRVLLETAWETFEYAGIDPTTLGGSRTAVFTGLWSSGYGNQPPPDLEGFLATGTATSATSGRVSYLLGLEGPAVSVDTACSSSLVAIHLAAQALRAGECSLALAGGVTVMATPAGFVEFSRQRGLAADGRVKAFAEAADGTSWGEGAGLLLLERLSDARRNGHRVLAVVRGSAVNQDGASNGLAAPNGPSQERVIRQALAGAGISAADVDVVEAHGTGTTLGDPIEAQALLATYGRERPADRPLWLGSVKSNIGHTQAAAGVAGVIKMVMAMRHGVLPRSLHSEAPSPYVDWSAGSVRLLTEARPWPQADRPRRAAVSSFGISGTNAHVILEQDQAAAEPEPGPVDGDGAPERGTVAMTGLAPVVLSARDPEALRAQAQRLAAWVRSRADLRLVDLALSCAVTRSALAHRAAIVADGREELLAALDALAQGAVHPRLVTGEGSGGVGSGVAFVFPGQGSQWAGMALGLLDSSPVFARRFAECEQVLADLTGWSLREVLRQAPGPPGLDRADVVQPALFAVMVSLAEMWRSVGVAPSAVLGHSQGEIAAACVAGVLSLADAARLVVLRSAEITGKLSGKGAMASLALAPQRVAELLDGRVDVSVAAVNGPSAVVVSGTPDAVRDLVERCTADGVRARLLSVDYASHSAQVDAIREGVLRAAQGVEPREAATPFVSTVTGERADGRSLGPEYWFRNLREPVALLDGSRSLLDLGYQALLEVSPHPVLTGALAETAEEHAAAAGGAPPAVFGTLRRDEDDTLRFLLSLAELHTRGVPIDWTALFAGSGAERVDLPTYAFQRRRLWLDPAPNSGDLTSVGLSAAGHPLLGASVHRVDTEEIVLVGRLAPGIQPWLAEHVVAGTALLPGAVFAELALRAGDEAGCPAVEELVLQEPLELAVPGATRVQLTVDRPDATGRRNLAIYSCPDDGAELESWRFHATGVLAPEAPEAVAAVVGLAWPPAGAERVDLTGRYESLAERGAEFGPAYRGLRALWRLGDEVFAEAVLPDGTSPDSFGLHPALLDAALQATGPGGAKLAGMPFAWRDVALYAQGATALRVTVRRSGPGVVCVTATDPTGAPVLRIGELVFREASAAPEPGRSAVARQVRPTVRRTAAAGDAQERTAADRLAERLAELGEAEQDEVLRDIVLTTVAAVLGFRESTAVDTARAFKDLGLDSVTAVELRNRLDAATGLRLPATLAFDHPTPDALVHQLRVRLTGAAAQPAAAVASRAGAADDPIAIVAMSCRYPGGVRSPEDLWRLVADGTDAITPFPADRGWDVENLYDPDPDTSDTSYVTSGGFLHQAAEFDAAFFGISPREAMAMDPQQRLLLESSWEAVERSGITPEALRGSSTGVFIGLAYDDYASRFHTTPQGFGGYLGNGSAGSIASGRIAYVLGLEGPAVTVDTACSSSLVSLHLACQALRAGECTMALAGGAAIMASPVGFVEFSYQRALSPDGRCRAFAAGADGFGLSEGVGVLVLERLSDARRNGHPVLAVVRGSAVNQDGTTNGLTAPSGPAQQRVIRQALAGAGLSAAEVDAVEAHGTGTTLGDPIEAQALQQTYGQDRAEGRPLWFGSLKSNLGHTQTAGGVAGVIKMVMAMRHGVLPRTLHAEQPSPHVDWSAGEVRLLTEEQPWPETGRPRRAGVSSFGMSGTNAHVVLEQAPAEDDAAGAAPEPTWSAWLFLVSGRGQDALAEQAARLHGHLDADAMSAAGLADVARSLATTRTVHPDRAVVLAADRAELLDGLAAIAAGEPSPLVVRGTAGGGRTAFLFGDPGAASAELCGALRRVSPVFAQTLDEACQALDAGGALREALLGTPGAPEADAASAAFAVEVALFRLVTECGVRPDFLLGRSSGALAAAHVAGVLSLADAAAAVRGALPADAELAPPRIPLVSDLTGGQLSAEDACSRAYWERHLAGATRFADGMRTLEGLGVTRWLELGDAGLFADCVSDQPAPAGLDVPAQGRPADHAVLVELARLAVHGAAVDFAAMAVGGRRVELPTYAFQHRRFWLDAPEARTGRARPAAEPDRSDQAAPVLAGVAPQERRALLLDTIRTEIAAVLAFPSAADVPADRDLAQIGFTSISAVAFRNRLAELTGLDLPTSVVLEHPSPDRLARHLDELLGAGQPAPATRPDPGAGGMFSTLYRDARDRGLTAEADALVAAATRLRPQTAAAAELAGTASVRLAEGPAGLPQLVCLPPFAPVAASLQFQGFAAALRGQRGVEVLGLPGFLDGELLPASLAAAIEAQAAAVARTAGDGGYVLVGYSSGGALAHAVTGALEAAGTPPQALVLLDAYVLGDMSERLVRAMDHEVMVRRAHFADVDHTGLTAMRRYLDLFRDWQPEQVATDALFVRPTDSVAGVPGEALGPDEWRSTWKYADEFVEVPGDHCSLMSENAGTTAQAVLRWLAQRENGKNA